MGIQEVLRLVGGLCLFLFGMNIMGEALERKASGTLRSLLSKLTTNKLMGFLTGLVVTAIIQSSSATTVMVVGFVNSGLMSLNQSIMVIMGSNIGTTVTAWLFSLVGVQGGNAFTELLKPSNFSPILALIGVIYYVFLKNEKKKETGLILLGFSTLMFGMETMSAAVAGLQHMPGFGELFLLFSNPILGALAGMILTIIIQSSSASTGILQALAATGHVTFNSAIPLIIGQNVGTCATSLLSSVGANKDAKRVALVHLFFNLIGATFWLIVYCLIKAMFHPLILNESVTAAGIAVAHSLFNVGCVILMFPMANFLEKLVTTIIPDQKANDTITELDDRLFASPSIALQRGQDVVCDAAIDISLSLKDSLQLIDDSNIAIKDESYYENVKIRKNEIEKYLVELSSLSHDNSSRNEIALLLKATGELYYISKQNYEIEKCFKKLHDESLTLSTQGSEELKQLRQVIKELLQLTLSSLTGTSPFAPVSVIALTQVIHELSKDINANHITRLQQHICTSETGVIWTDLLVALVRACDHFANIANYIIEYRGALDEIAILANEDIHEKYCYFKGKYKLF